MSRIVVSPWTANSVLGITSVSGRSRRPAPAASTMPIIAAMLPCHPLAVRDNPGVIEMGIAGAWVHTPDVYADSRGAFLEWFRQDRISAALGHAFAVAQANVSVSKRGALRGIHF